MFRGWLLRAAVSGVLPGAPGIATKVRISLPHSFFEALFRYAVFIKSRKAKALGSVASARLIPLFVFIYISEDCSLNIVYILECKPLLKLNYLLIILNSLFAIFKSRFLRMLYCSIAAPLSSRVKYARPRFKYAMA